MKKLAYILLLFITTTAAAQERGSHLTIGGGVGTAGLHYDWQGMAADGTDKIGVGGNLQVVYSYFFTRHWGVGTGVGVALFRSQAQYNRGLSDGEYLNLGTQSADNINFSDLHSYELRARIADWRENQTVYTLNIPLMLQYQTKFGKKQAWGMYGGVGVKLHFPMYAKFAVQDSKYPADGRLNVSGASFASSNIEYGSPSMPPLDWHGFGTVHNPSKRLGWNGKIDLKPSISAVGNFGFLWTLAPRVDLLTGIFVDYGFNNIKKINKALMEAPENYSASFPQGNNSSVGAGISYNGIVNSQQTSAVRLFAWGAEIGVRIRLCGEGKASKPAAVVHDTVFVTKRDTVFVKQESKRDTVFIKEESTHDTVSLQIDDSKRIELKNIYYESGRWDILPESTKELDKVVRFMHDNPDVEVELGAHTDSRGADGYNLLLSERRAQAAVAYIVSQGIDKHRITAKGYGEMLLRNGCANGVRCAEQQHRENRRTEIFIK